MHIRPARIEDIPALLEMVAALAAHHGDPSHATEASLRRDLFGSPDWGRALIAEAGGRALGYAALIPRASLQNGTRGMDLHHLFVAEEARGRGVGRALIGAAEAELRALGGSFLLVGTAPGKRAAQEIYRHCGFVERAPGGVQFSKSLMDD